MVLGACAALWPAPSSRGGCAGGAGRGVLSFIISHTLCPAELISGGGSLLNLELFPAPGLEAALALLNP